MNKYEQYGLIAEQKFVEKNITLQKISEELNIPLKTLYGWKRKNNWSEKRKKHLSHIYDLHNLLYELLKKLVTKSVSLFDETGELPDSTTLNFISKLIDKLPKLKTIEVETLSEKLNSETESSETDNNIIEVIDKYLKGI